MNDAYLVFALVLLAIILFASNRARLDFVALLMVLALTLSGILTVDEAFAGFGNPIVLLVAGLLVVGEMLDRTGVAQSIGEWITHVGAARPSRLLILIMFSAAVLSSVMSSTAVVAIFIPIIFKISRQTGLEASRLLLPMSLAAMIGGMLTLIATMPNMVISDALGSAGLKPLRFFSFSPIGLAVLSLGIVYMLAIGNRLLSSGGAAAPSEVSRSLKDLWNEFTVGKRLESVRVPAASPLAGQTIREAEIETRFGVHVLGISRTPIGGRDREIEDAGPDDQLMPENTLLVTGESAKLREFIDRQNLALVPISEREKRRQLQESGAGVIMIHPNCRFLGKSIRQMNLRTSHGIHVLGFRRGQELIEDFAAIPLRTADTLLVSGPWQRISALGMAKHDFVLLELPAEFNEARPGFRRAPLAIAILAAMVLLSLSGLVPISVAVMIAAVTAVVSRCLTAEDAYRSISWSSLVLLAGMLPVAHALEKTGGTQMIVDAVISGTGSSEPLVMMTLLFFLTAGLSLFLSNTATAVLLAPVAIRIAQAIDVSPYPFAITVLIGASAAFASPVASPVITLVVEPGRYRFIDFLKVGGPLMLIAYVVNIIVTPLLFPL